MIGDDSDDILSALEKIYLSEILKLLTVLIQLNWIVKIVQQ